MLRLCVHLRSGLDVLFSYLFRSPVLRTGGFAVIHLFALVLIVRSTDLSLIHILHEDGYVCL